VALDSSRRLADLLHGPAHTLVMFAGASTALLERFNALSEEVTARFGRVVRPTIIRLDPAHPAIGEVDRERRAHERYGAGGGAIYLVRPDGHIAFRGAGTDVEALRATLRERFTPTMPARE